MNIILITGVAGFIGSRTAQMLLDQKYKIIGIDNLNNYYDIKIKYHRVEQLNKNKNFVFLKVDIEGYETILIPWLIKNKFLQNVEYIFIETHEKIDSLKMAY